MPNTQRRFALGILLAWLLTAAIMIAVNLTTIAQLAYPDADDQLRLLQVRDFIAGQSWFDVTQYRMNPPAGAPMHWSRLVDLPIAAIVLLATPPFGAATAETIAAVAVPLITLGCVMALAALVTRRLLGWEVGLFAALIGSTSPSALQQLRPLRVDHHGWQMAFALAALLAVLDCRPRRSGLLAGGVLALWLQVSLEGLPFAAGTSAVLALRWALKGEGAEAERFRAFGVALAVGSLLLFAVTHAPAQWPLPYCDAISPPHLVALTLAALGAVAVTRSPLATSLPLRILHLAALGAICLAAFLGIAPVCGTGAFAQLEPRVYEIWYRNVLEGLPLWRQAPEVAINAVVFPLLGLVGAIFALRRSEGEARILWTRYVFMLVPAICAAILVQRAGAVANMVAVPGAMAIMMRLLARARASGWMLVRVLGAAGAVLLLCPITPAMLWLAVVPPAEPQAHVSSAPCATTANLRLLDALPPSLMLAGLDVTPGLLLETHHRGIASSHHRNHAAMDDVLAAFTGSAEQAHAVIRRRGVRYILFCPQAGEVDVYRYYAPNGFMMQLIGRPPAWLRHVEVAGAPGLRLWEVVG